MSRDHYIHMRGMWDIRHWIKVPSLQSDEAAERIQLCFASVDGIAKVMTYPHKAKVRVTYDQSQIDYTRVLALLQEAGYPASESWWNRLKAGWFQYLDEKNRNRATATP